MLRSTLLAAAFLGLSAPAFAGGFTFETTEPVSKGQVIALSTVWKCEDTVCKGDLDRKKVTVRLCKKIAKEAGEITAFSNGKSALTAEELAECKSAARGR